MLRMGADLGLLPPDCARLLDTILVEIQPAHLQTSSQRKLSPAERDLLRASFLRDRLRDLPPPHQIPGPQSPPADGQI
jgi:protein arginine kinase